MIDSTGTEIRRGSTRPLGKISGVKWNKLSPEEKRDFIDKVEKEKKL